MMKLIPLLTLLVATLALSGCYHTSISTGLPVGADVVENKWASGWVYGLVPPKPMDVSSQCTEGTARVETKLSFLNQLVSGLTFGIYTPMHITVTCASGSMSAAEGTITPSPGSVARR